MQTAEAELLIKIEWDWYLSKTFIRWQFSVPWSDPRPLALVPRCLELHPVFKFTDDEDDWQDKDKDKDKDKRFFELYVEV